MRFAWPILALSLLLPAGTVFAQAPSSCTCYCSAPGGAKAAGTPVSDVSECDAACGQISSQLSYDSKVVACTAGQPFDIKDFPTCFKDENDCAFNCSSGPKVANQPQEESVFDSSQPPVCPVGYHYCYCVGKNYPLEIPIGANTTVKDVGDYVQTIYHYLLGISIIVAVVMVMIGGLQYLLTASGSGGVSEAKTKITNAVVGLVLLFGAAVILQTVNPQLLNLEIPRLPVQRKIVPVKEIIGNCEDYTDQASCEADAQHVGKNGCLWFNATGVSAGTVGTVVGAISPVPGGSAIGNAVGNAVGGYVGGVSHCEPAAPTGGNGQLCKADGTCTSGLNCVQALTAPPQSQQGKVCTDGQINSPCASYRDCKNGGKCANNWCAAKTGNPQGGNCSQDTDCATPLVCKYHSCASAAPMGNGGHCVTKSDCTDSPKFGCLKPSDGDCSRGACQCSDGGPGAPCYTDGQCNSSACAGAGPNGSSLGRCH